MKRLIYWVFFFVQAWQLQAQNTFEVTVGNTTDEMGFSIIENQSGEFIISGLIENENNEEILPYIVKISPEGELLAEKKLNNYPGSSCLFLDSYYYDNCYYFTGIEIPNDSICTNLLLYKIDSSLSIVFSKKYGISQGKEAFYASVSLDSDTNFIITGYVYPKEQFFSSYPYFYKLNINGDSITSKVWDSTNHKGFSYHILESGDKHYYYAFCDIPFGTGSVVKLTKDFDSLAYYTPTTEIWSYYTALPLADSNFLVAGKDWQYGTMRIGAQVLNSSFEPIAYNYFITSIDTNDIPAFYGCADIASDTNFYIGGTSHVNPANPYFSTTDSKFHLIKTDNLLNPVWERWYGGDACYFMHSLIATQDGGCAMVGTRYDENTQNNERDIYVIKVNADGLVTWEKEIPIPQSLAQVYPNPGKDRIILRSSVAEGDFRLTDMTGKTLIDRKISQKSTAIDTQELPAGTYLWTLTKDGKQIASGKWVKAGAK